MRLLPVTLAVLHLALPAGADTIANIKRAGLLKCGRQSGLSGPVEP